MNVQRKILLVLSLLVVPMMGSAQTYPSKLVRIVVPWAPGGIDVVARAIAVDLSIRWGQPVIVDNRPGADSIIGAEAVAKSPPDGYTLMATTVNPTIVSNRFIHKSLPYDPERSFLPISELYRFDTMIVAHPSVPASNLNELIELARQQPGKFTYGTWGMGTPSNLVFELLKSRERVDILSVPYKGIGPTVTAIVAGEVDLTAISIFGVGGLVKAGKLKALAVAGRQRSAEFPKLATSSESGFPYVQATSYFALFAPAGTPSGVVQRIYRDVDSILREPGFVEKQLTPRGFQFGTTGPEELAAIIRDLTVLTEDMIRAADIRPQ
jgi:tripartite-type tricarboxylate transporter receptor subunit TctC